MGRHRGGKCPESPPQSMPALDGGQIKVRPLPRSPNGLQASRADAPIRADNWHIEIDEDAGGDQQHALATIVHRDSLALSPCIRLMINGTMYCTNGGASFTACLLRREADTSLTYKYLSGIPQCHQHSTLLLNRSTPENDWLAEGYTRK